MWLQILCNFHYAIFVKHVAEIVLQFSESRDTCMFFKKIKRNKSSHKNYAKRISKYELSDFGKTAIGNPIIFLALSMMLNTEGLFVFNWGLVQEKRSKYQEYSENRVLEKNRNHLRQWCNHPMQPNKTTHQMSHKLHLTSSPKVAL